MRGLKVMLWEGSVLDPNEVRPEQGSRVTLPLIPPLVTSGHSLPWPLDP